MGGHVLVSEFLERAIKPFGHGSLRFPLCGIVVDAILVQQPFHVLVVILFTLIGLQLDGPAMSRFVFQQMGNASRTAVPRLLFKPTTQAYLLKTSITVSR